jgi:YggT family protein
VPIYVRSAIEAIYLTLTVLIFGRVLVSFVDPHGRNALSAFIIQVTEPILGPVRRMLPRGMAIDFSPMIVLIVLSLIYQAIRS